jgi:serine protease Do
MKNIKYNILICLFIMFIGVKFNISAQENGSFENVIKKANQSVVLLSTNPNADPETNASRTGLCTGTVVDNIGHVITNFHCIYKQNYIKLYYHEQTDWREYEIKIIGVDPLADLALLKIIGKKEPIPYLEFVKDTNAISVGADVFAIGHPMGMIWSVTKGIVSSIDRFVGHPFIKAIQTDSAINKGNSGGPLLNMKGEIVGINTLIVSTISENAGIGLAIRSDIVKTSLNSMLMFGKVDRPAIGVMVVPLNLKKQREKIITKFPEIDPEFVPNTFGVFVLPNDSFPPDLNKFDTIIGINGVIINTGLQFSNEIYKYNIGETVALTIVRKRRFLIVNVLLKRLFINADVMYASIRE